MKHGAVVIGCGIIQTAVLRQFQNTFVCFERPVGCCVVVILVLVTMVNMASAIIHHVDVFFVVPCG